MDGFLNVWKPPGLTSFQVVHRVRRISGQRRVGHGGTLDPAAEGVLPVALGQATRAVEYLHLLDKAYRAEVLLGVSTDTYDAQGQATGGGPVTASRKEVEAALAGFRGGVWQRPPPYSALKMGGQPLYARVRAGEEVTPPLRKVCFHRLELAAWQPPVITLDIECSAGTYIRSLAHDLGQALGCGAHLLRLRRLRSGPFVAGEAVPLDMVEQSFADEWWRWLYPLDVVMLGWPAAVLGPGKQGYILHGRPVPLASAPPQGLCRAYTLEGWLMAVLRPRHGEWYPDKVFSYQRPSVNPSIR
ncbi:MAG: tRNA pseudouridine(55) synthase TruB [Chloroflexi bacterium]|nr:tRNA pseudouridine(55) synthase TruB [Chloroflexota bacterium]